MSIGVSEVPNEIMMRIANFLDARSKDSFSKVSKRFREIIENTGLSLSMLGFSFYLTNELFISDLYDRHLASKNVTERETFKSNVGDQWFEALSDKSVIPDRVLTFAICDLSANRGWLNSKIKKLCLKLNYEAIKEIPNVDFSWKVVSVQSLNRAF